jgi:SAM-dependent methyltransferase
MSTQLRTGYTAKPSKIWNDYYKSFSDGPVGNLYPNEPLIRIISTVRKGVNFSDEQYFHDQGQENANRTAFSGKALEIGFGHVSNLMMLSDKGFSPIGIEVSEEAVARGKVRIAAEGYEDINLMRWNPTVLPFENEYFDFICGLQCIYYNREIEDVIGEVFRCLKPDGHFAFSFFSKKHDYHKYIDILEEGDLYNIVRWSDNHPSYRIRGGVLVQPKSKDDLMKMFSVASDVRIFTEETDFTPTFNSWWYIYGRK